MNTPRFNLRDPGNPNSLIVMVFRYKGKKVVISTGMSVDTRYWNAIKMRAREVQDYQESVLVNGRLEFMSKTILEAYRGFLKQDKLPTPRQLKKSFEDRLKGNQPEMGVTVNAYLDRFIEERRNQPHKYRKGTIINYTKVRTRFHEYVNGSEVYFEDLTIPFFKDFVNHLFKLNYSQNYVDKLMSTFRTIIRAAQEDGLHENLDYQSRSISVGTKPVDNIYLNEDELKQLYVYDLKQNPRLEKVRDLFLVGAYTGLRYSDYSELKPQNLVKIEGHEMISVNTMKTNKKVYIPLHPIVKAILKKYEGKLPKGISNQKTNDYLKELCKLAGITGKATIRKYNGGNVGEVNMHKYELVKTHTARRSFATNAYKAGVPIYNIMKITGHSKSETFFKYIRIDEEENAVLMAGHEFFS